MTTVGKRDKVGNLLILGGHKEDLLQLSSGSFNVGQWVGSSEEDAVTRYNQENGTSIPPDYIQTHFTPWALKNKPQGEMVTEIPSSTDPNILYAVKFVPPDTITCNCPGFMYRSQCKHTKFLREMLEKG